MPWVGGTFRLLFDFRADQAAGEPYSRITADRMMQQLEDIAATMAEGLRADGSVPMSSNLDMNGHKIVNAANASSSDELVTLRQAASNLKYAGVFDQISLGVNDVSAANAMAPNPITQGYEFEAFLTYANSGPMTCAFNGGTRRPMRTRSGTELEPGDARGNQYVRVLFNGTEYRIQGPTMREINGDVVGAIDNPNRFIYVESNSEVSYKTDAEVRDILGLKPVATSGSYGDLINKPNVTPIIVAPIIGDGSEANPLDIDVEALTPTQLSQIVAALPVATSLTAGVVDPATYRVLSGVDRLMRYYGREFLIDPLTMPSGTSGVAYSYAPTTASGEAPHVWSLAPLSDALPSGLAIDDVTGAVTGTPTSAGTANIIIRLTDANGFYRDFPSTLTIA